MNSFGSGRHVFASRFVDELPADYETDCHTRQVLGACYSLTSPTAVAAPQLIAHSSEMAEELGIDVSELYSAGWVETLAGNRVGEGSRPYAACYGGHQFGNWAGQLGDGRAISLGELGGKDGRRWELQLKGAGPTPYSRRADGRAVMRSSVREFLCSEAMHHLGVPTTRALSLISTGDRVVRDMFYDGHPEREPGAIVCRVAPSFLRFGNYEIFASRGDDANLKKLVDFTLRHFYPELLSDSAGRWGAEEVAALFAEVARRTATMVVEWMRVGFVHGVMNTDNMSILGLTIDYGPYGWLEDFDPTWTPNTTDAQGRRYRFGAQPRVCEWNLAQLGNALLPLVGRVGPLEQGLEVYREALHQGEVRMMANKLGLSQLRLTDDATDPDNDRVLIEEMNEMLQITETDMTLFYRGLSDLGIDEPDQAEAHDLELRRAPIQQAYYRPAELTPERKLSIDAWLQRYSARVRKDRQEGGLSAQQRIALMKRTNPKYVLRNYLAQLAIDEAEKGDGSVVMELLEVLRHPYDEQPGNEKYAEKRPEWARFRPGCSMLSCSS